MFFFKFPNFAAHNKADLGFFFFADALHDVFLMVFMFMRVGDRFRQFLKSDLADPLTRIKPNHLGWLRNGDRARPLGRLALLFFPKLKQ